MIYIQKPYQNKYSSIFVIHFTKGKTESQLIDCQTLVYLSMRPLQDI